VDTRTVKRLVLPATLVVTAFISASSCKGFQEETYCIDIENQADCDDAEGCGWSEDLDECTNICGEIDNQADCEALDRCDWSEGLDDDGTDSETGGGESCHEPFS
jgi:hypothetical protein